MNTPEQLFNIGVKGLIRNASGKYLCVQSSKGYYDIPGGRISDGEEWVSTLSRELKEELNLDPDAYTVTNKTIALPTNRILQKETPSIRLFILIQYCDMIQDAVITLNHENQHYSWETARDLYEKVDILWTLPFESIFN